MKVYLDTSALVKLYYPEPESASLARWVSDKKQSILFSFLQELELKNTLYLKVFWGHLKMEECQQIVRTLEEDIHEGTLTRPGLNWGELFIEAFNISATHSRWLGSRSLDILHVMIALQIDCTHFLTFDERQARLAKKTGMKMVNLG